MQWTKKGKKKAQKKLTKFKQSTTKQRPIGNIACKENNTEQQQHHRRWRRWRQRYEKWKKRTAVARPNSNYSYVYVQAIVILSSNICNNGEKMRFACVSFPPAQTSFSACSVLCSVSFRSDQVSACVFFWFIVVTGVFIHSYNLEYAWVCCVVYAVYACNFISNWLSLASQFATNILIFNRKICSDTISAHNTSQQGYRIK